MRNFLPTLLLTAAIARADALTDVLARMDKSAANFKSFSAKFHRVDYHAVLQDKDEENGSFRMMKAKGGTVGIADFEGENKRTIHFTGHEIQIYHPKAKSEDIYDTSKFTRSMDQFLLIGFGTSSAELKKTYDIKLGGEETIDGKKTTRIELIPKSAETRKNLFTKIELWYPDGGDNPIREKVTESSNDTLTFTFSDIQINPSVAAKDFELNLPPDVQKHKP